jgi:hypothetical protein
MLGNDHLVTRKKNHFGKVGPPDVFFCKTFEKVLETCAKALKGAPT